MRTDEEKKKDRLIKLNSWIFFFYLGKKEGRRKEACKKY